MLVEYIEHSLELHLRHLGEHPDVFDVDTLGQGQPPGFHKCRTRWRRPANRQHLSPEDMPKAKVRNRLR
jgi:hypothetical protein